MLRFWLVAASLVSACSSEVPPHTHPLPDFGEAQADPDVVVIPPPDIQAADDVGPTGDSPMPGDAEEPMDVAAPMDTAPPADAPEPQDGGEDTGQAPDIEQPEDLDEPEDAGSADTGPQPPETWDLPATDPGTCTQFESIAALPFATSGSLAGSHGDELSLSAGSCIASSVGKGGPERVYGFTAPVSGKYVVALIASFDSALYVLSGCDTDSCLAGKDVVGKNKPETVTLSLTADQTALVVVDGFGPNAIGSFTLTIGAPCQPNCGDATCGGDGCGGSCGTCALGSVCKAGSCEAAPKTCQVISAVACGATVAGASNGGPGSSNAFAKYSCQGLDSLDFGQTTEAIYSFQTDSDALVSVTGSEDWLQLLLLPGAGACPADGSGCIAAGEGSVTFPATAGQDYYLVWDSALAGAVAPSFDFQVACDPLTLGLSCSAPTPVSSLPATLDGDTADSKDSSSALGCAGATPYNAGSGQPDAWFEFTAPADGTYLLSLPSYSADPSSPSLLSVRDGCGPAAACVAFRDFFDGSAPLALPMMANQTVMIVVDSLLPQEVGPFQLTIGEVSP